MEETKEYKSRRAPIGDQQKFTSTRGELKSCFTLSNTLLKCVHSFFVFFFLNGVPLSLFIIPPSAIHTHAHDSPPSVECHRLKRFELAFEPNSQYEINVSSMCVCGWNTSQLSVYALFPSGCKWEDKATLQIITPRDEHSQPRVKRDLRVNSDVEEQWERLLKWYSPKLRKTNHPPSLSFHYSSFPHNQYWHWHNPRMKLLHFFIKPTNNWFLHEHWYSPGDCK